MICMIYTLYTFLARRGLIPEGGGGGGLIIGCTFWFTGRWANNRRGVISGEGVISGGLGYANLREVTTQH